MSVFFRICIIALIYVCFFPYHVYHFPYLCLYHTAILSVFFFFSKYYHVCNIPQPCLFSSVTLSVSFRNFVCFLLHLYYKKCVFSGICGFLNKYKRNCCCYKKETQQHFTLLCSIFSIHKILDLPVGFPI